MLTRAAAVYANPSISDSEEKLITEEKVIFSDTIKTQSVIQRQPQQEIPMEADEQDFDKIRKFESYDPATGLWSSIEDFKTVEIFEDTTQRREENYIYESFWAYNANKKHWYKVNIRNYGYKYRLSKGGRDLKPGSESESEDEEVRDSAWKNLNLNLSIGGGGTWYEHKPQGLNLVVRDKEYFLQSKSDLAQDKAYLIKWFRSHYKNIGRAFVQPVAYSKQAKETISMDKAFSFRGIGLSIPITASLHYTFLKRFRLGLGSNFEIDYLKRLKLTGAASHIAAYELQQPWIYNFKWFGLVGYKFMLTPVSAIVVDTQVGMVYDVGSHPEKLWPSSDMGYFYRSWYANMGIGYEKKLNRYLKFTSRLSGDYKNYDDVDQFSPGSTVKLYQIGLHLDVGLSLNFAKDTDGEEPVDLDVEELGNENEGVGSAPSDETLSAPNSVESTQ
jgi:hypothetical protein